MLRKMDSPIHSAYLCRITCSAKTAFPEASVEAFFGHGTVTLSTEKLNPISMIFLFREKLEYHGGPASRISRNVPLRRWQRRPLLRLCVPTNPIGSRRIRQVCRLTGSCNQISNSTIMPTLQVDHSGCAKPLVDIKTKVPF